MRAGKYKVYTFLFMMSEENFREEANDMMRKSQEQSIFEAVLCLCSVKSSIHHGRRWGVR